MTMLVSLEQARAHLRSDTDADDADLILKIESASESVLEYLGAGAATWTDSAGDTYDDSNGIALGVPSRVKIATLLTIAELYNERAGSQNHAVDPQFGYGYPLPKGAIAKLYPLRRPTVK